MKKFVLPCLALLGALATLLVASVGSAKEAAGVAPAATAQGQFDVAVITDIGGLNDRGFNQLANQGLQRAIRQLNVRGRVFISRSEQDYVPNLTAAVRQGYDLIVPVGFLMATPTNDVAKQFPSSKFAIVDVDVTGMKDKPTNVRGILFKEQETGCLVGHLAAKVAKRRGGAQVISSVGGLKIPPVDRFIAGYQHCAKRVTRTIRTLNAYSQDFVDQSKCKEAALNQISRGSKVVFQVAGGCGLGALDAAKERRVWGIGVDADQGFLGQHVLTSAVKKVDVGVFLTIRAALQQRANFRGGFNSTFGLKNNGVGTGRIARGVPAADVRSMNVLRQQIIRGRVRIPTRVP